MKLIVLALAALTAVTVAQRYDVQSRPFKLVISSTNDKLDGWPLYACTQGYDGNFPLLGLCSLHEVPDTGLGSFTTFYHNSSSQIELVYPYPYHAADDIPGILTWDFRHDDGSLALSFGMDFKTASGSDLADMIFSPGSSSFQPVWFQAVTDFMYIPGDEDDTVIWRPNEVKVISRNWYVCTTVFQKARHASLVWKIDGGYAPLDTCVEVDVVRKWLRE